jgi:hypothetical protein
MELVSAALEQATEIRESYLRSACAGDVDLFAEVSERVEWEQRMGGFLGQTVVEVLGIDRPPMPGGGSAGSFCVQRRSDPHAGSAPGETPVGCGSWRENAGPTILPTVTRTPTQRATAARFPRTSVRPIRGVIPTGRHSTSRNLTASFGAACLTAIRHLPGPIWRRFPKPAWGCCFNATRRTLPISLNSSSKPEPITPTWRGLAPALTP